MRGDLVKVIKGSGLVGQNGSFGTGDHCYLGSEFILGPLRAALLCISAKLLPVQRKIGNRAELLVHGRRGCARPFQPFYTVRQ